MWHRRRAYKGAHGGFHQVLVLQIVPLILMLVLAGGLALWAGQRIEQQRQPATRVSLVPQHF